MKNTMLAAIAATILTGAAALSVTGCASTKGAAQTAASPVTATAVLPQSQPINWKGAAFGEPIPQWARDAINNDYNAIAKLPQFEGKIPVIRANTGKNLDGLRTWVNNVDVKGGVATALSTKVRAKAGGEGTGKVDESYERFVQELVADFSQVEVNGLAQEMDYWVLSRHTDADGKAENIYNFIVVYSIDRELFSQQVKQVLAKNEPKSEAEKKFEDDLQEEFAKLEAM